MKFLKNMFRTASAFEALQKDIASGHWARALGREEALASASLDDEERRRAQELLAEARRGLALLNLEEAEAFMRAGQPQKVREHLEIAAPLAAGDTELEARIHALGCSRSPAASGAASSPGAPLFSKSCSGCGPVKSAAPPEPSSDAAISREVELELVLSAYGPELARRYLAKSEGFQDAFLLAQQGRHAQALEAFAGLDAPERDDLFHFEYGSLLLRSGQVEAARKELAAALELQPDFFAAFVTLVDLEIHAGRRARAMELLRAATGRPGYAAFCHQHLAMLLSGSGELDEAIAQGRLALEAGAADAGLFEFMGKLFEARGATDEAESFYGRIPAGGCGGAGVSLALATFWLRQRKHPAKVLDALNKALKSDPGNPLLLLQTGEAYCQNGWKKEGGAMFDAVLAHPQAPEELRLRAQAMISGSAP